MSQTVVITGANRGIGLALTQLYLSRGDTVYAICRQPSDELKQSDAKVIEGIDVTDEESLKKLKAELQGVRIELLINNAGILRDEQLGSIDYDSIREQFEVNAIGPLRVTETLKPQLQRNGKVAVITSRMGSIADNTSGGRYGYRMSKAALNAAAMSLVHDLQPQGVTVAILHPGYVQTDMVNHSGDISAEVAASRLADRVDELNFNNTGTFWHSNGDVLPW